MTEYFIVKRTTYTPGSTIFQQYEFVSNAYTDLDIAKNIVKTMNDAKRSEHIEPFSKEPYVTYSLFTEV